MSFIAQNMLSLQQFLYLQYYVKTKYTLYNLIRLEQFQCQLYKVKDHELILKGWSRCEEEDSE